MDHFPYSRSSYQFFRAIPKVDLHRHLEGSIRLSTLMDIGRSLDIDIPETGKLRELVQISEDEVFSYQNFLSKFKILRYFFKSQEIIERITIEAIEDASKDNVRYLELRFTPAALSQTEGFLIDDIIRWVSDASKKAEHLFSVITRLIVSVNRHESQKLAEYIIRSALDHKKDGVLAVDLAGDEANFPGLDFAEIFREAKKSGLKVSIHAGEWSGAENVRNAIIVMEADRIGHGVRILEDPSTVMIAKENQIPFEVCITSNYQSGVIDLHSIHPFSRMVELGLNATINTDDPSISGINLSDEYQFANSTLGIDITSLFQRIEAAAEAAFLSKFKKDILIQSLSMELDRISALYPWDYL